MNLLEKLETLINKLLFLIGDLCVRAFLKIVPAKVIHFYNLLKQNLVAMILWLKNLPKLAIAKLPLLFKTIKANFLTFDFKEKLQATYKAAMSQYLKSEPGAKFSGFKTALLTPFLMMGQWLKGLSVAQTLVLLGFTSASFLSGVSMMYSGNRIMEKHSAESRAPASAEEEVLYERPNYYKKPARYLEMTSLRLPVFFANVNELRTVDIDVSATLSNRFARMKLEKLEFQLRDHLILNVEPILASFPLEDEGKSILREKIMMEINQFMKDHKIEGEVTEMKLIYILAN